MKITRKKRDTLTLRDIKVGGGFGCDKYRFLLRTAHRSDSDRDKWECYCPMSGKIYHVKLDTPVEEIDAELIWDG